MNLKNDENARARLADPQEILMHLAGRSGDIERMLDDDEDFCNKEIDAQLKHMDRIDEKWREKVRERRKQLEQVKETNRTASGENKKHYDDEMEAINELFSSGQRTEGECRHLIFSVRVIAIVSSVFKRSDDSKTTNEVSQHGKLSFKTYRFCTSMNLISINIFHLRKHLFYQHRRMAHEIPCRAALPSIRGKIRSKTLLCLERKPYECARKFNRRRYPPMTRIRTTLIHCEKSSQYPDGCAHTSTGYF